MTDFKRIGVLAHPTRPHSAPLAEQIAGGLAREGLEIWHFARWTEDEVRPLIANTDLVVAIGGDGAMLRAARVCAPSGVPLLGVNMGHLGFLTEIRDPSAWQRPLNEVLSGAYWIESRMMLRLTALTGADGAPSLLVDALNDAVISRGALMGVAHFDAYIDEVWITRYHADGLIIASASGSTAYALACGGPILPPELRSLLLVPVAPHLSLDRPIVLPEGAKVEVRIAPDRDAPAALSADGTPLGELRPGDRLRVEASEHVSRFVRLRKRSYFYRSLLDRLEPRISAPPPDLEQGT